MENFHTFSEAWSCVEILVNSQKDLGHLLKMDHTNFQNCLENTTLCNHGTVRNWVVAHYLSNNGEITCSITIKEAQWD